MYKFLLILSICIVAIKADACGEAVGDNCKINKNCPVPHNSPLPKHLPFPGNCNKFLKCSGECACEIDCPAGLHFSVEQDVCESPAVAKCDDTGTPTVKPPPPGGCCTPNCIACPNCNGQKNFWK